MTSTSDAAGRAVASIDASTSPAMGEIVLGRDCGEARAQLGPTAWFVLEELVLEGEQLEDHVVVATTVRALAGVLGLSKDTVASALRRLTRAGIVRREEQRDRASGFFGHSHYLVDIATTGLRLSPQLAPVPCAGSSDTAPSPPSPEDRDTVSLGHTDEWQPTRTPATDGKTATATKPKGPTPPLDDGQLSLLDPDDMQR